MACHAPCCLPTVARVSRCACPRSCWQVDGLRDGDRDARRARDRRGLPTRHEGGRVCVRVRVKEPYHAPRRSVPTSAPGLTHACCRMSRPVACCLFKSSHDNAQAARRLGRDCGACTQGRAALKGSTRTGCVLAVAQELSVRPSAAARRITVCMCLFAASFVGASA